MKKIKGFLVLITILATLVIFIGSVSAANLNLTDAGKASSGVKNYTAAHGHIPGYVYINNNNISSSSMLNIVTTFTVQLNKSTKTPVTIIKINTAKNPSGSATGTLQRSEYIKIANNIKNYISTHKTAPNYASSSLGNIRYESLVYAYSRIINYYNTNNRLPNNVVVTKIIGTDTKGVVLTKTADSTAPKVISTSPTNNANGIYLTSPITIKFSENITAGANYSGIYIKNLNTNKIVTITKSISLNTLTIKQSNNRLNNNLYQVYLPIGAVKDKQGNKLAASYSFKFKTVITTKTYSGYGVSFSYPANWKLQTETQDGTNIIMVSNIEGYNNPNDAPVFLIQIVPVPDGMSDQEAIDSIQNSGYLTGATRISNSTPTINGNKFYENIYTINNPKIHSEIMENKELLLVKNENIFIINFQSKQKTFDQESNFDVILKSLRI